MAVNMDNFKEYNIYAGLGGSFGGAKYMFTTLCESQEEAEQEAFEQACAEYDDYSGCYGGLTTWAEAQAEAEDQLREAAEEYGDEVEESEIEDLTDEIYSAAREEWIVYYARLTSEDTETTGDTLIKGYLVEESGDSTSEVSSEGE